MLAQASNGPRLDIKRRPRNDKDDIVPLGACREKLCNMCPNASVASGDEIQLGRNLHGNGERNVIWAHGRILMPAMFLPGHPGKENDSSYM